MNNEQFRQFSLFIKKVSFRHSIQRLPFIATGYRSAAAGALTAVGTEGNYRSSSSYAADGTNANRAANLNFNAGNVNPLNNATRASALTVRCVQASAEAVFCRFWKPDAATTLRNDASAPGVTEVRASVSEVVDSAIRCPPKRRGLRGVRRLLTRNSWTGSFTSQFAEKQ